MEEEEEDGDGEQEDQQLVPDETDRTAAAAALWLPPPLLHPQLAVQYFLGCPRSPSAAAAAMVDGRINIIYS